MVRVVIAVDLIRAIFDIILIKCYYFLIQAISHSFSILLLILKLTLKYLTCIKGYFALSVVDIVFKIPFIHVIVCLQNPFPIF